MKTRLYLACLCLLPSILSNVAFLSPKCRNYPQLGSPLLLSMFPFSPIHHIWDILTVISGVTFISWSSIYSFIPWSEIASTHISRLYLGFSVIFFSPSRTLRSSFTLRSTRPVRALCSLLDKDTFTQILLNAALSETGTLLANLLSSRDFD